VGWIRRKRRLCVEIGSTSVWPSLRRWPWRWDFEVSLMDPSRFGVAIFIESTIWEVW
jgi:hypothetical protein